MLLDGTLSPSPRYIAHSLGNSKHIQGLALFPLQCGQHISRSEVAGPHLLVVDGAMTFGVIISIIVVTFPPIIMELFLVFFISHVLVIHIFRFGCFGFEVLRYKSQGSGVVSFGRSGGLLVTHLLR